MEASEPLALVVNLDLLTPQLVLPQSYMVHRLQEDFLEDQVAGKYFLNTKGVDFVTWEKNHRKQYTQIDGEVMLCQKANQQFNWHGDFVFVEENKGQHIVDEKHFLTSK